MEIPRNWLSEKEACVYTTLSRGSLSEAREAGKVTFRQYGRKILYKISDLDHFIEHNSNLFKSAQDHLQTLVTKKRIKK